LKFTYLISLLLVLTTQQAVAAPPRPMQLCVGDAVYGFPSGKKSDTTQLCRTGYSTEYDNQAKIPIWGAYLLTPIETTGCFARTATYTTDLHLPVENRSTPKDYAKSGYDTGHMVNDGDMRWSYESEAESFLLSNMTPQLPGFNRGIWKKLEESTRGWTLNRKHPMQIYVGPIYDRDRDLRVGKDQVTVPHGFWKIIIDTETKEVMVFKFDHVEAKGDLTQFMTSLAEVQRATGLILPMPDNAIYANRTWPRVVKSVGRQKNLICSLKIN
jgi:endonuclease G